MVSMTRENSIARMRQWGAERASKPRPSRSVRWSVDIKRKLLSHLPPGRPNYLCDPLALGRWESQEEVEGSLKRRRVTC